MRDENLKNLSVISMENQDEATPEQIKILAERFPNVINADARELLHLEVLDYVSVNLEGPVPIYKSFPVVEF